MNVFVAGTTGYLGRYVVQEFKRQGHWLRALVRKPERLASPGPFLAPAVRDQIDDLFVGQVTQPETSVGICDGIHVVFSSVGLTRITQIPSWLARLAIAAMQLFDRHAAELFEFLVTAGQYENAAPSYGTHTLDDCFRLLSQPPAGNLGLGLSIP